MFHLYFRLTSDLQLCSRSSWLPLKGKSPGQLVPFSGPSFQSQHWRFSAKTASSGTGGREGWAARDGPARSQEADEVTQ